MNDDGTVQGTVVETFYRPCKAIMPVDDGEYLRVIADDEGYDTETRIAYATLTKAGFINKRGKP